MAIVKVPQIGRTFIMPGEIQVFLSEIGVDYARWSRVNPLPAWSPPEEILSAYKSELETYRLRHGFAAYDVVDLTPDTPKFEEMLAHFKREHWHNEVEAHFVLAGRGFCNIHPAARPVVMIELEPGDLLSVGPGIRHWFDLCAERRFRAIRFLARPEGSHADYTNSGIEADFEPVCMGPAYFPYRRPKLKVRNGARAA
ncbi:MAG: hypothetical protein WBE20_04115 [Candidatus Acidiferrales bacterium]